MIPLPVPQILIPIILALVILSGIGYFALKNNQINTRLTLRVSVPSPTITPSVINKEYVLGKLIFEIPTNWSSQYTKNQWYPIEAYDIDPDPNFNPNERVSTFEIRLDKEKTNLQKKDNNLIQTWHLIDIKKEDITVSNIEGIKFTGKVNPKVDNNNSRFLENATVKIALFIKDDEVYHLLGDITNSENEKIFDQILSTFKFTD